MSSTESLPARPLSGSCLCTSIKFTISFSSPSTDLPPAYSTTDPSPRNSQAEITSPATWPPKRIACHCTQCRHHTGALVIHFITVPSASISWAAPPTEGSTFREYQSSPGCFRGFCEKCGSTLTWRKEGEGDELDVCLGTLDGLNENGGELGRFLGTPTGGVHWAGYAVKGVTDGVGREGGCDRWLEREGGAKVVD